MAGPGATGSAIEQAERSIARLFVAARAAQLSFSTLMVIGDRRRFGRPKMQFVVLALATAESAWLARRLLAAGASGTDAGCGSIPFPQQEGLLLRRSGSAAVTRRPG